MSNLFDMASTGKIDTQRTIRLLSAELLSLAKADGACLPTHGSAMELAQAYRAAKDPEYQKAVVSGPANDRGVALARALGLLAAHEIMKPRVAAMRRARAAAAAVGPLLAEFCAANDELRRLGQWRTPLFEGQEYARRLSLTLTAASLRMPPSFSSASDAQQEEALLMNVTLCLSAAFKTAEIARLVDDRGDGDLRARRARVRTRKRTLESWQGPLTELWCIPDGYRGPGEEIGPQHSASAE